MPSDPRIAPALGALRAPIDSFRSAVGTALAQVTDYLDAHRVPTVDPSSLAATALGAFAAGRVDANRFAATFAGTWTLTPEDTARVERCRATLAGLLAEGDAPYVLELAAGEDLEGPLAWTLARVGRAFGALLAFQAVRAGVYREEAHGALVDAVPFERWNRAERLLAPPLVVSLDGADLDPARLARFVDGRVRLVLLARGAVAPAALVSLVTPGVLVMQTEDVARVAAAAEVPVPAVVAVVGADAALFTHDPAGGARLGERLTVERLPAEAPRRAIGRYAAAQLGEQVAQLRALAEAARGEALQAASEAKDTMQAVVAAAATRGDAQAVDALAGWLLDQAGLVERGRGGESVR
ncbi:MAG TPA: hypothetical protein VEA99_17695 [Gemmatimonadaceae bacterium]|nr:hypothetical protein [Gemmatimonadaceae bacterium]